jgi:hypothetical protein
MPGSLGVGWMLQRLPFQRSAIVNGPDGGKPPATAVHAERDGHETPVNPGPCPTAAWGVGVRWIFHAVPFQRSARSLEAVLPTAVQVGAELQETAVRMSPGLFEVGVGWLRQLWPFQRSVIVPAKFPELSKPTPTAVQAEVKVHETPVRKPPCIPVGVGTCWVFQFVPFQRSASRPEAVLPTAVQADADVQETEPKKSPGL